MSRSFCPYITNLASLRGRNSSTLLAIGQSLVHVPHWKQLMIRSAPGVLRIFSLNSFPSWVIVMLILVSLRGDLFQS